MQRQSLGSPLPKLHITPSPSQLASDFANEDDNKSLKTRRHSLSSSSSSSLSLTSPSLKQENAVHLIPVLMILCFLILFLFSHSPSQSDLAQFNVIKPSLKLIDTKKMDDVSEVTEIQRGEVLAIKSVRILQEMGADDSKVRRHRKIADF